MTRGATTPRDGARPGGRAGVARGLLPLMTVQVSLYAREPIATFFTIAFAPLLLLLFGFIYGNEPNEVFGGRGSMDVTVPAYIGLVIVTVGLIGIPIQTATNRELGVLRRYRLTPMRPLTYVVADVAAYYLMTLTGTILLIAVGALAFGVRMEGSAPAFLAGFTLSALAFFSLGYVLAGLAPSARAAQTIGMVIAYPMMFLSGASLPLELLPPTLRTVADFIPLTYVVQLMRGLWFGLPWADLRLSVAVLTGILVVGAAVSARVFRWQ
jgi:ABC-2 type transport system permease protein